MTSIKLYRSVNSNNSFNVDETTPREFVFSVFTPLSDELSPIEVSDLFFHATNAPKECLDGDESALNIRKEWKVAAQRNKLHTPSVGDAVEVNGAMHICENIGWRRVKYSCGLADFLAGNSK